MKNLWMVFALPGEGAVIHRTAVDSRVSIPVRNKSQDVDPVGQSGVIPLPAFSY
jgi:hypothetical protein